MITHLATAALGYVIAYRGQTGKWPTPFTVWDDIKSFWHYCLRKIGYPTE